MQTLTMIAQVLAALSILVLIHELGHFLAAKLFKIKVDKFYLFFDFLFPVPSLLNFAIFKFKRGDTEYGLGWFPMGGYVQINGMVDENMGNQDLTKPAEPWEFRSKPAWQRFIVMIGGITMNIILGILIFAFWLKVYKGGYPPMSEVKNGIYAYELGREVGLKTGDKIIAVNGKPLERATDLASLKIFFGAVLTIERDGKIVTVDLPDEMFQKFSGAKDRFVALENYPFYVDSILPETGAAKAGIQSKDRFLSVNNVAVNSFGAFRESLLSNKEKTIAISVLRGDDTLKLNALVTKEATLGFIPKVQEGYEIAVKPYTIAEAFYYGTKDGFEAIYFNAVGLGKIFTGKVKASESVQSPIGIAQIYGGKWQWDRFWYLTGLISFILAFMNILPIPALDGGHVVFIIIEVIQGKPVSEKVLEWAQMAGMVLLLGLMVFAFGNDIYKELIK
jgi:regulator of sigma E protease